MSTAPLTPAPDELPLIELDDVPPADDQAAVAAEIRALMGRHKVSQSRLASAIGLSSRGMSERLNGKTNFTLRELGRIARLFRVSIRDLFPPLIAATAGVLYVTRNNRPPEQLQFPLGDFFLPQVPFTEETHPPGVSTNTGPAEPPFTERQAA